MPEGTAMGMKWGTGLNVELSFFFWQDKRP
jgi:hypothetical protein